MFFTTLVAAPILAGLLAGVWTARRAVPWALAGICVTLGIAGAVAIGLDSETTDRGTSVAFALVAGVASGALVWAGYGAGRLTRRRASTA